MNVFNYLKDKKAIADQKKQNLIAFNDGVNKLLANNELTPQLSEEVQKLTSKLDISVEAIRPNSLRFYETAFAKVRSKESLTEQEEVLKSLQSCLGIQDNQISPYLVQLSSLKMLTSIKQGILPHVIISNLVMTKDEITYLSQPAKLVEEKVIRRRYTGGSGGASVRIAKGLWIRSGSSKGQSFNEIGPVITSNGSIIITNKRIVYMGDKKSFSTELHKVLTTELHPEGFQYQENAKSKPKTFVFAENSDYKVFEAVLSYAINNYSKS